MNSKGEYNEAFDGEEQLGHRVIGIKSHVKVYQEDIDVESIAVSEFKKVSREDTLLGLSALIKEWGLVSPIHVLKLEDDDCYLILNGLRSLYACVRNKMKSVRCWVWDFEDKEEGKQNANIIGLLINRSQKYSAKEQWSMMQKLELMNDANPGLIEYLLQMQSGDAMKLKDVMTSDADFAEIQADLIDGTLTIEQAYKKLCNQRKKEDRLAKEEERGVEMGDVPETESKPEQDTKLSIEEAADLLDLADSEDTEEKSLEDLDKSNSMRDIVQDSKNRHPLDSALRIAVLGRDKFTCQCCGTGGDNEAYLDILVVHHKIQVAAGGPDTKENLVTLCQNCHMLVHNYIMKGLHVDYSKLQDKERDRFKKIMVLGNISIKAFEMMGKKGQELRKEDRTGLRHCMPGENLKENRKAFEASKVVISSDEKETEE